MNFNPPTTTASPDIPIMADLNTITQHISRGQFEAAERHALDLLREMPNDAQTHLLLTKIYAGQLSFDKALERALHLIHVSGDHPAFQYSAAWLAVACLAQLGAKETARALIRSLNYSQHRLAIEMGWESTLLMLIGDDAAALHSSSRSLAHFPNSPGLAMLKGSALLATGDPAGQADYLHYTSRAFFRGNYASAYSHIDKMWVGEDLAGKHVVIRQLGGFGDFFQHIRHAPLLRQLGATKITAIIPTNCRHLIASADIDAVACPGETDIDALIARCDYWVSDFGLLRAEALCPSAPIAPTGYLIAPRSDAIDTIAAAMRAQADGRPCIGIYWHSDAQSGITKSVPFYEILPLLSRHDIHWVILQGGFGQRQFQRLHLPGTFTRNAGSMSFDDVGALMAQLDGVVSVCAYPVHLAGALGIRCWMLASRAMNHRHMNAETHSVLYPDSVTIHRQPTLGDWKGAVASLTRELDAFVAAFP